MKNVIHLRRVHELEPHVIPAQTRTLTSFLRDRARDFLLMWPVHTVLTASRLKAWASRIDWALVTLCVMLVVVIVLTCLSAVGLGSVLGYPSFVHIADFMGLPR
ncbi:MAG TPA: hypothetical protein VFM33_13970 [Aquabacterium sp.]|nr:hypothetical protein [Aquabacterium sp.]